VSGNGGSATQNGAFAMLLEKCPELGGIAGIAIDSFTANRTALQRKEGIEEDPDDHEADTGLFGRADIHSPTTLECGGSCWVTVLRPWIGEQTWG
jgi:hypothetical protein